MTPPDTDTGTAPTPAPRGRAPEPNETIEVFVPSEYGTLRTVVMCFANPLPEDQGMLARLRDLDLATVHQLRRWRHERYHADKVHFQQLHLVDVLERRGVRVLLAEQQAGIVSQHYTRDIAFAIDDVLFVARPRRDFRQRELGGIRTLLTRLSRVAYLDAGTIEGGDVMLHDGHVLVGLGEETSRDGVDALAWALEREGIERALVTLEFTRRGTIHLDDELNIIAPNLALVHRPAFTPASRRWIEDHLELIEVTEEELAELRVNALALAPDAVVVERGGERLAREIERRGIETIRLDYSEVNRLPGSFRCTTLPLRRDTTG